MIVDKEMIDYLSQMIELYETNPGMRLGNYCVECNEAITEYDDKWHVTYKGDVLICCEGFIPFTIEDGMLSYKCGGHIIINDESERQNKDDILIADKLHDNECECEVCINNEWSNSNRAKAGK